MAKVWVQKDNEGNWTCEIIPQFLSLSVWPADKDEEPGKYWASIELDFVEGNYFPVTGPHDQPFPSIEAAQKGAEEELNRRLSEVKNAFRGLVRP